MNREKIFEQYPWLTESDLPMIVSADLEGLLCAALLHHHLGWRLVGIGQPDRMWLAETAADTIGVNVSGSLFARSITTRHTEDRECASPHRWMGEQNLGPFPLSLPLLLLWLFEIPIRRDLVPRLLTLAVGDTLDALAKETAQVDGWLEQMPGYDWPWMFAKVGTPLIDRRLQELLYTPLSRLLGVDTSTGLSGITFNPDWDTDMMLNFFAFVGTTLKWSPPALPTLHEIDRNRAKS